MELSQITPFNVHIETSKIKLPHQFEVLKVECVYSVRKPDGTVVTNRLNALNGKYKFTDHPNRYKKNMNKPKKIRAFTQQIKELENQKALAGIIITLGQQIANQNVLFIGFQQTQENLKILIQNITAGLNNQGSTLQQQIAQLTESNRALQATLTGLNQNQQDVNQRVNGLFIEMRRMMGTIDGDRAQESEILTKLNELERLLLG